MSILSKNVQFVNLCTFFDKNRNFRTVCLELETSRFFRVDGVLWQLKITWWTHFSRCYDKFLTRVYLNLSMKVDFEPWFLDLKVTKFNWYGINFLDRNGFLKQCDKVFEQDLQSSRKFKKRIFISILNQIVKSILLWSTWQYLGIHFA